FKPKAVKALKKLLPGDSQKILAKIGALADSLQGDVKKLTNFRGCLRSGKIDNSTIDRVKSLLFS
ncbi:MAG: type II toxin-antitoxin system RelE family toxin, partial [Synechocystis sp.]